MTRKAILALASRWDLLARTLVERLAPYGACLVTPESLSVAGWHHYVGDGEMSVAVAGVQSLPASDIRGVVTRLPSHEQELDYVMPADRAYVAAEMNAFLLAWLTQLRCPMLNRPTPTSLWGPAWRHEQWVHTVARLGIPVATAHRGSSVSAWQTPQAGSQPSGVPVTLVGHQHFGEVDQRLAAQARRLADTAGVDLLTVRFSSPEPGASFVNASLWTEMIADEVADAMLEYLGVATVSGAEPGETVERVTDSIEERAA